MSDQWKIHANDAKIDIVMSYLETTDGEILFRLRSALVNVGKAIDAVENRGKGNDV